MKHTIILAVFILLVPQNAPAHQTNPVQSTGRVTGTVYDPNEAVFAGITVVLKGAGVERKVTTNEEGVYSVDLPAGLYQVSLEAQGLLPYRRAPFTVRPGESVMINIAPAVSSIPIGVLYVGPPDKAPRFPPDKSLKYDSFSLGGSPGEPHEVLVEFRKKRKRRALVEYKKATVSCDLLLVYGANVRFSEREETVEAEGNVIIENGKRRVKANRVVVKIKGGAPEIVSVVE